MHYPVMRPVICTLEPKQILITCFSSLQYFVQPNRLLVQTFYSVHLSSLSGRDKLSDPLMIIWKTIRSLLVIEGVGELETCPQSCMSAANLQLSDAHIEPLPQLKAYLDGNGTRQSAVNALLEKLSGNRLIEQLKAATSWETCWYRHFHPNPSNQAEAHAIKIRLRVICGGGGKWPLADRLLYMGDQAR